MKAITTFSIYMIALLAIGFGGHHVLNTHFFPEIELTTLLKTYVINLVVTILIYALLVWLKERFKGLLGFLFLGSGFLKFFALFTLLLPGFKSDGDVSTSEFISFFIPYAICLVFEVVSLIRLLKD